ncbi:MAG: hypothetical protein FWE86_01440 [Oscillospiraceae bacterium]|nr:hypothetical protein [Oscillospiraceae bacterium]
MIKTNNIFSPGIYKEGLRQGKILGLAYVGLAALVPLFILIAGVFRLASDPADFMRMFGEDARVIGVGHVSVFWIIPFWVLAPLLCLTVYHFLNTRAGSDHWHALPQPRAAVFFSLLASVMTWCAAGLFLSICPFACYDLIVGGWSGLAPWIGYFFGSLLGCLQVSASVLLAMGISSVLYGQIAAALLIIFLPRGLLTVCYDVVAGVLPVLPPAGDMINYGAPGLMDYNLNIAFGSVVGALDNLGSWGISGGAFIYTSILTILLTAAACALFVNRKSEHAGMAANSRVMAQTIPAVISFIVCAIPITGFWRSAFRPNAERTFTAETVIASIMYILIGVLVYFILYAISAKSVRGLAKGLPGLGILAGLCVVFVALLGISHSTILNFTPAGDEISYVKFAFDSYYGMDSYMKGVLSQPYEGKLNQDNQYGRILASEVRFTDQETKGFVSSHLKSGADKLKDGRRWDYDNWALMATIVTESGRKATRLVYLPVGSYDYVGALFNKNPEYVEAINSWPAAGNVEYWGDGNLTRAQIDELIGILREEYAGMDAAGYRQSYELTVIGMSGKVKGKSYNARMAVDGNTPRAAARYIEMLRATRPASPEALLELLRDEKNPDKVMWVDGGNLRDEMGEYIYSDTQWFTYYDLTGQTPPEDNRTEEYDKTGARVYSVYDANGEYIGESSIPPAGYKRGEAFFAEMTAQWDTPVDPGGPLYKCSFWDGSKNFTFFLAAAEEDSCLASWHSVKPMPEPVQPEVQPEVSGADVSFSDDD